MPPPDTTPPELARLLAGLHDNPADGALWLVVADWLEEQGQPERAELTRLNLHLRGTQGRTRTAAEDRLRVMINGGVRPCVPEVVNVIGMRLVLIPPGEFWMGSPKFEKGRSIDETSHRVTLTRPFWMGVHPVTQAQYEAVTGRNPSHFAPGGEGSESVSGLDTGAFPVEMVSWDDAVAFCRALSSRPEEHAAGRVYRLPSEAEWEYACRAGLWSKAYHFGDTLPAGANFAEAGPDRTCAVGSATNAWGLSDMHGNVWEWVADWYGEYPGGPLTDPRGREDGVRRVYRGGCCRSAYRSLDVPGYRASCIGFRVAGDITSTPAPRRAARRTASPPRG